MTKLSRTPRRALMLGLPALALGASGARAQAPFPNQAIRLVVPQSAGSGGDILARLVADPIGQALGQPVVVDNRPGANGVTATNYLKQLPADGHAIMLGGVSMMSFNQHLYPNLPYDPLRDFTFISPFADTPYVLVASKRSGLTDMAQLVARAKAAPESVTFSSAGIGNGTHLSTEMTAARAGIRLLHAPYNGSGPALTAVVSGQVDLMTSVLGPALPLIRAGQITALAVVRRGRSDKLPQVPTVRESGIDAPITPGWYAMVGPAGIPEPAVARLNAAIRGALDSDMVRRRLNDMDIEPALGSAADLRRQVETDSNVWGAFIRSQGLKIG